jgi:hypothetical protein
MQPGDIIAERFVAEHLAGGGGMGAVWRALDRHTGAPVAVKVLHHRVAPSDAARLAREAQVLAGLRHPGVVRYVDHGTTADGFGFLVMEWLDGEDLAARLRAGPLGVGDSLVLLGAITDALAAVHARGVVHRDLKPQNIFLPGGDLRAVKLVDFGIARWDEAMYAMTRTGTIVGTPGYMAPEQARGERDLDARVDVFALGCVVFECLAGSSPFAADNMLAALTRLALEDAPRVRAARADVPPALDELVAAMLVRDPARRFAHGAALRAALDAIGAQLPTALAVADPVAPRVSLSARELRLVPAPADPTGRTLDLEPRPATASHTLLGRASPFVGRERELRTLTATWEECVEDSVARAVLVTGAAGSGKSRLRDEWLRGFNAPGGDAPLVLLARGDAVRAGAPYGLVSRVLRLACGVDDEGTTASRQAALRTQVARTVGAGDVDRVTHFLGELAGVGFPEEASAQLRAARHNPRLMGDQVGRSWEDWLAATCERRPVMLVLDDVQWGDRPSLDLVDAALRALHDRSLLVLALGRPEVHERFPGLWAERAVQALPLGELSRRAAERLVRMALGDVEAEALERVIARAGGNAFLLEELLRAVAEGRGDVLPESVRAVAQARLETLAPEHRRLLRAASVFGRGFPAAGVAALLGQSTPPREELEALARLEMLQRRSDRGAAEREDFVFRHDLLREAAYAMLTEDDRALGHRLAGAWLEQRGETDALLLAEHFERGGQPERGVPWWLRAAEQALGANDLAAALERAERGVAAGAAGEAKGALRALEAEVLRWQGLHARADGCAQEALALLPRGAARWYEAASELMLARWSRGDRTMVPALAETLFAAPDEAVTFPARARAISTLAGVLPEEGRAELERRIEAWFSPFDDARLADDPLLATRVFHVRSAFAHQRGDTGAYLTLKRAYHTALEALGDRRNACINQDNIGYAHTLLGQWEAAEAVLRGALAQAESMGLSEVAAGIRDNLAIALARLGALDEARAQETTALAFFVAHEQFHYELDARFTLAFIDFLAGDLEAAERAARLCLARPYPDNPQPRCQALLARILLASGRGDEAMALTSVALAALARGEAEVDQALVRLARAEALWTTGDLRGARAMIVEARTRLLARADRIADRAQRASFLERVPENASTLALALALTGESPAG